MFRSVRRPYFYVVLAQKPTARAPRASSRVAPPTPDPAGVSPETPLPPPGWTHPVSSLFLAHTHTRSLTLPHAKRSAPLARAVVMLARRALRTSSFDAAICLLRSVMCCSTSASRSGRRFERMPKKST